MRITIIIPVKNAEKTIEKAVDSVLLQEHKKVQLILVENNSTDASYDKCEKLLKKYEGREIHLCRCEKMGVSAARNKGLLLATGEIIGFLDADDYLENDSLKYVDEFFTKNPDTDLLFTGYNEVKKNGIRKIHNKKAGRYNAEKASEQVLCNPKVLGSVCTKYYTKNAVEGITFDEELTHLEDGYFNIKLLTEKKELKTFLDTKITYNYVQHEKSATNDTKGTFDENGKLKYTKTLEKMLNELKLSKKQERAVKEHIFRLSAANLEYCTNALQKEQLLSDLKKTGKAFRKKILHFDYRAKISYYRKARKNK